MMDLSATWPVRFVRLMNNYVRARQANQVYVANYDVTPRCNIRCEHCYFFKTLDQEYPEPSDEEWKDTFVRHRDEGIRMAYITGGEPALRPGALRAAHEIFDHVIIISNGTIKIPEDIQRRIFISIDGNREIHNTVRRAPIFDKIMRVVSGDKRVMFTPTLSTTNYHTIDEMVRITRDASVTGITFSLYTAHGRNIEEDPLLLRGELLEEVLQKLEEVRRQHKDIVFLTRKMIQFMRDKGHVRHCGFLQKRYVSYYPDLTQKYPCVLGAGVNCKTCGCIVPIFITALKQADLRAFFLMHRMYPQKFVRVS